MSIHKRRPSWLAVQRRLAILVHLVRGPAGRRELIQTVSRRVGPDASGEQPFRTLESDLRALRCEWNAQILYDRADQVYRLTHLSLPLLDLPEEDLHTLAFLYHNFSPEAPQGNAVRSLLDRLVSLLNEEARQKIQRFRTIPDLTDLEVKEELEEELLKVVEKAVTERRELRFGYRPAGAGEGRIHRVQPYGVDLRAGHYYLEAYCLEMHIGKNCYTHRGTLRYRLSRIVPGTAEVLPAKFPPGRKPRPVYTLRYRLSPQIAGGGVTPRFPETQVRLLEDGSAEVEAQVVDLWWAHKTLLRYGEHCRVLEPPKLVEMMRQTAQKMAKIYAQEG